MRYEGLRLREDGVPILSVSESGGRGEAFAIRADGRPWRDRGPRTARHERIAVLIAARALAEGWPPASAA